MVPAPGQPKCSWLLVRVYHAEHAADEALLQQKLVQPQPCKTPCPGVLPNACLGITCWIHCLDACAVGKCLLVTRSDLLTYCILRQSTQTIASTRPQLCNNG